MIWSDSNLIHTLKSGGVAVMPTDTIYGIVGKAENEETVRRIYEIKRRAPEKPCIILISDMGELEKFSIALSEAQREKIKEYWSFGSAQDKLGAVSIILDCPDDKFSYLHRGTNTLAFRMPVSRELRELLKETGPLVAPSANPEALPPARNIEEAKRYFGDTVDMYEDAGEIRGKASKIVRLHKDGAVDILRQ